MVPLQNLTQISLIEETEKDWGKAKSTSQSQYSLIQHHQFDRSVIEWIERLLLKW